MKNLIKLILILIVLTFMFIKVYVPLMNQEKEVNSVKQNPPFNGDITTVKMKLRPES